MADQFTGIDGENREIRLPEYALEITQERILDFLVKAHKISREELGLTVKSMRAAEKDTKERTKESKVAQDTMEKIQSNTDPKNTQGLLQHTLRGIRDNSESVFRDTAIYTRNIIGGIAVGSAGLLAVINQQFLGTSRMLTELQKTGLSFGESQQGAGDSTLHVITKFNQLGLSTEEAVNYMKSFARSSASLGQTGLVELNKQVLRASKMGAEFGLTISDMTEMIGENLDSTVRSMSIRGVDERLLANITRNQIERQMEYSRALGISMAELRKFSNSLIEETDNVVSLLAGIGDDDLRATTQDAIRLFGENLYGSAGESGKALAEIMLNAASGINPFADPAFVSLLTAAEAAGASGITSLVENMHHLMHSGQFVGETAERMTKDFEKSLMSMDMGQLSKTAQVLAVSNSELGKQAQLILRSRIAMEQTSKGGPSEQLQLAGIAMANAIKQIRGTGTAFKNQLIMASTPMYTYLGKFFESLMANEGVLDALRAAGTKVTNAFKNIMVTLFGEDPENASFSFEKLIGWIGKTADKLEAWIGGLLTIDADGKVTTNLATSLASLIIGIAGKTWDIIKSTIWKGMVETGFWKSIGSILGKVILVAFGVAFTKVLLGGLVGMMAGWMKAGLGILGAKIGIGKVLGTPDSSRSAGTILDRITGKTTTETASGGARQQGTSRTRAPTALTGGQRWDSFGRFLAGPAKLALNGAAIALGMAAIGKALPILSTGLKSMSDVEWSGLGKSGVAFTALSVGLAVLSKLPFTALAQGIIGLGAVAGSMYLLGQALPVLATGFKSWDGIGWKDMMPAGAVIGALTVAVGGLGKVAPMAAKGAGVLLATSGALWVLANAWERINNSQANKTQSLANLTTAMQSIGSGREIDEQARALDGFKDTLVGLSRVGASRGVSTIVAQLSTLSQQDFSGFTDMASSIEQLPSNKRIEIEVVSDATNTNAVASSLSNLTTVLRKLNTESSGRSGRGLSSLVQRLQSLARLDFTGISNLFNTQSGQTPMDSLATTDIDGVVQKVTLLHTALSDLGPVTFKYLDGLQQYTKQLTNISDLNPTNLIKLVSAINDVPKSTNVDLTVSADADQIKNVSNAVSNLSTAMTRLSAVGDGGKSRKIDRTISQLKELAAVDFSRLNQLSEATSKLELKAPAEAESKKPASTAMDEFKAADNRQEEELKEHLLQMIEQQKSMISRMDTMVIHLRTIKDNT
jgi:hypothetical protein